MLNDKQQPLTGVHNLCNLRKYVGKNAKPKLNRNRFRGPQISQIYAELGFNALCTFCGYISKRCMALPVSVVTSR